jgi:hypothetical protein
MATKTILTVEIDDSKWKDFKAQFDKYQAAVAKLSPDWAKVAAQADKLTGAHEEATESVRDQGDSAQRRTDALTKSEASAKKTASAWATSWGHVKNIGGAIEKSSLKLAKWGSLAAGALGGLGVIGAGASLFGIDRMARDVASMRRSALGLGATYGQTRSINTNYGQIINPGSTLSNIATGKYDAQSEQYKGLRNAGISDRDIQSKNSAELFAEFMEKFPERMKGVSKGMMGATASTLGFTSVMSMPEIIATLNEGDAARKSRIDKTLSDAKSMDLNRGIQDKWTAFVTQLDTATERLRTVFMTALSGLAEPLTKVSDGFVKLITAMADSGLVKGWMDALGAGMEKFADYVQTQDFKDGVSNFVSGFEHVAEYLWNFVASFGLGSLGIGAASAKEIGAGGQNFQPGDTLDASGNVIRGGVNMGGGIGSSSSGGGGGSAPNAGEGGWWNDERMVHMHDRLMKEAGLSDMGASALVARAAAIEAAGGPTSANASGHEGIGQWDAFRGGRGMAKKSFDDQITHEIEELNGPEYKAAARLRAAQTPEEGSIGASTYERAEHYNPVTGVDDQTFRTPTKHVFDRIHGAGKSTPKITIRTSTPNHPVHSAAMVSNSTVGGIGMQ